MIRSILFVLAIILHSLLLRQAFVLVFNMLLSHMRTIGYSLLSFPPDYNIEEGQMTSLTLMQLQAGPQPYDVHSPLWKGEEIWGLWDRYWGQNGSQIDDISPVTVKQATARYDLPDCFLFLK